MSASIQSPVIEAAGGVVERSPEQSPTFAVIYRERYGPEWALPKGKREPGESWQQTALREVYEEIGLRVRITGLAGATFYMAKEKPKVVLYWRMQVDGDITPFRPNNEARDLQWLPLEQAIARLTHPDEAQVLRSLALKREA